MGLALKLWQHAWPASRRGQTTNKSKINSYLQVVYPLPFGNFWPMFSRHNHLETIKLDERTHSGN
jgi:hypothetical protein